MKQNNFITRLDEKMLTCAPLAFLFISHAILMTHTSSRMYIPYMISSYILAAVVYFNHPLPGGRTTLREFFFGRDLWLHKSAINDYTLFIFNFIVYFNFLNYIISDWGFLQNAITHSLDALHIAKPTSDTPGLTAALIYTICLALLGELAYYITHRAYHEIPFLWELHKVHHSAEVMTPITFIRAHPIDLMIQNSMKLLSIAIASGVFLYFYPNKDGAIMVAGIDAAAFIYYMIGANLHHSHIWVSFGKPIEYFIMSPAQHQIHHSTNPKHFDKNYGSMLSFWDWIFKSLYIPEKHESISFGLGKEEYKNYDSTFKLLYHPIEQMFLIAIGKKKTPRKKKRK